MAVRDRSNTLLEGLYSSALLDVGKGVSRDFGIPFLRESGVLTLADWLPHYFFSNLHENLMNMGDFYAFAFFNSFNCFA